MTNIDEQLESMLTKLRAAGAVVGVPDNAPEAVKKVFIQMVLDCPDCRAAIEKS